jgi:hypothetical protein
MAKEKGPEQRFRAPAQFETSLKGGRAKSYPPSGGREGGTEKREGGFAAFQGRVLSYVR